MRKTESWAAIDSSGVLQPFSFALPEIGADEVEVEVEYCGLCYSDLAMIRSEWGPVVYPLVAGHEIVGTITSVGADVRMLKLGDRVGIGWNAASCNSCRSCVGGDHNLCADREPTIVGRPGGFAKYVRAHWLWAFKLPRDVAPAPIAPMLCGGLTVFSPFLTNAVRPTHRVAVVGIGGLGHMAVQVAKAWGCEVTAITSSVDKLKEAKEFGAHHAILASDTQTLDDYVRYFDFILVTGRGPIDWDNLVELLAPNGKIHQVGVTTERAQILVRPHLISWRRSFSGSSTGSPAVMRDLLTFASRHNISPKIELLPMSSVNIAIDKLNSGLADYRIVLETDFG